MEILVHYQHHSGVTPRGFAARRLAVLDKVSIRCDAPPKWGNPIFRTMIEPKRMEFLKINSHLVDENHLAQCEWWL